ncbi:VENN motif pre-toxin domain-containing protein, partial [Gilliamella apicola]
SDGELIIRDQDKQTQDINELSHDTENAHSKLKPIFNKEDEQTRLNIVTSLKELGEQVKELERTIHKDAGKDSKDGKMGNDFSKGVDSAVSIITGIITGDMTGGLAGASAPWLAEQINIQAGDNETARLVAHAIFGAVVAELQGNSALSGGVGAVTGEVAADIIRKQLYGKEVKDLTEEEKQTISALSQLASGLAVAAGGGNIGDASAAISSSKNAVENNYLSKGLPDSCSTILNNQDWKNQQDADYNLNNPILIAERAKDARYILSYLGMDTSSMTDKEAVDKVNEIGLMTSAGIMGAGKGKGSRKDNTTGKVNQVKPQVLDPIYANDTWKPIKRFELVQKDGVWYTVGNNGTMFRARGTYDYVTINGKIYVSKTSSPGQDVGHFDISRGAKQVDYAGSVQFGWNSGTRGVLKGFDNSSGHYKPSANDAHQSGFPLDKFKGIYDVK